MDESGSAVTDFIFVSIPLIAVALSTMAIIQAGYLRNLMIDAAVEGARWAANADGNLSEGAWHAKRVLKASLGTDSRINATAVETSRDGLSYATVRLGAELPALGLIPIPVNLEVSANSSLELQ